VPIKSKWCLSNVRNSVRGCTMSNINGRIARFQGSRPGSYFTPVTAAPTIVGGGNVFTETSPEVTLAPVAPTLISGLFVLGGASIQTWPAIAFGFGTIILSFTTTASVSGTQTVTIPNFWNTIFPQIVKPLYLGMPPGLTAIAVAGTHITTVAVTTPNQLDVVFTFDVPNVGTPQTYQCSQLFVGVGYDPNPLPLNV
jgi:hypothetical protein